MSGAIVRAAGGVVWRVQDGGVHVALVHRPRYDDWSLPKGKLDDGESELAAAVREIHEELGSRVAVSRRLRRVEYPVQDHGRTVDKSVAYWAMRHVDGEFTPNDEVDAVRWLTPADAAARTTYEADRNVLADFRSVPVPESLVVLVRHAKAGKRSEWQGCDDERPLEKAGRAQAERLARFLAPFAADRVVSANPTRCVQTVTPLADRLGVPVEIDPVFADEQHAIGPASAALLALAAPRRACVVCSQGETIPGLVEAVAHVRGRTSTRKGAAWVLSVVDGAVVAADYYDDAAR